MTLDLSDPAADDYAVDLAAASHLSDEARLRADNARFQWHPMAHPNQTRAKKPLIIARGSGARVQDLDGRSYVDGVAGLWCVNVGHGRREVIEAITAQMAELSYYSPFDGTATPPSIRLSRRIIELTGKEDMARVMFSNGGSDAVETAMKLARQYWRLAGQPTRTKFISLKQAYHGVHFGGASLNGMPPFRGSYEPLLAGVTQVTTPWLYRNPWNTEDPEALGRLAAAELEREIVFQGPETVAAFFAEPIQGAGGVIVPPANYWPLVREICDRHGVLLIADEVVTGFGRSGALFGARGWGVKPDIMCFAKGITSGYVPLGATVVNRRVADAWERNDGPEGWIWHGYTYTGHPLACAAALAALEIVEREDLPANAARRGDRLLAGLTPLVETARSVGDVRGKGLMIAVDLVADKATREPVDPAEGFAYRIADAARERGAIVRPVGTKLILSPPLVITDEEIDVIVEALQGAFAAVES